MQPLGGTFTFESPDLWMSEFRLRPTDPRWTRTNVTTDQAILVAVPRTTVGIRHEGRPEVVADPTCAVFYAPGQPYRRRLLTAVGDDCTIIAISTRLADQAGLLPARQRGFPFAAVPLGRRECISAHRARHVAAQVARDETSRDAVREELYWLVGRLADAAREQHGASEQSAHRHATVNAVREQIGSELAGNRTLDELAERVHLSPFHLARTFRQQTGRPIHAYRAELRLRASLAPISDGVRLADVAQDLGFASHSHLTDRFRRAFGLSPHEWRARLDPRSALEAQEHGSVTR